MSVLEIAKKSGIRAGFVEFPVTFFNESSLVCLFVFAFFWSFIGNFNFDVEAHTF